MGRRGLQVSPICLGITDSPATVEAAFEAGVNFFFISADLHWPLYEATRRGLERLLKGNRKRRDEIVVGIASYFEEPWFGYLQFWEVIDAIPALERVDLLIAGGVTNDLSFDERTATLRRARAMQYLGARSIGASLHKRKLALLAQNRGLDISYIRYNAAHPGARSEVLSSLPQKRRTLLFNFKSVLPVVSTASPAKFAKLRRSMIPAPTDHYRFALSAPEIDGILCSPRTPLQVFRLLRALEKGPMSRDEQDYMLQIYSQAEITKHS